jgi:hypothetical protein
MGGLHLGIAGVPPHAQHGVGIAVARFEVFGAQAFPALGVKAEDLRHLVEIVELVGGYLAVGPGNVEQALEQLLEDGRIVPEHASELARIGFEATDVLARLVEQPTDVLQLLRRNVEDLLEGADLVASHHPVGLCHLGAEDDHADGESDVLGGVVGLLALRAFAHLVDRMTGQAAQERAQRPAERETGRAADNFTPNAHVVRLMGPLRVRAYSTSPRRRQVRRPIRVYLAPGATRPMPGSLSAMSKGSTPRVRPSRFSSTPSSTAARRPRAPNSETWYPVPLGLESAKVD